MSDDIEARIELLGEFKEALEGWQKTRSPIQRQWLNQNKHTVEREVIEAGCFRTLTVTPPSAVGGYVAHNVNPFDAMFQPVNFYNLIPVITCWIRRWGASKILYRNQNPRQQQISKFKSDVAMRSSPCQWMRTIMS
jgi:hypothetical protein